ncbi:MULTISPECIES: fimbrial protein [Providencia]|uniref:Fimbrial protein n=1 Tax=Providencia rettgeri TaxID=587 RepID=A0AAE2ZDU2_PRORE|nr:MULTISPECIES: fimbrial protein [Providencia]MRF68573.1 fimbrial protein [Escherichia coli]THB28830.1 type 1 fimbrial protein [Providencia sp. MGF014]MBG5893036.1 fimbrial protein [Providencia rettgeri]MBI6190419.1 fimbrial protein [Providencia rettgeri]MBQ0531122.1 fimbrial protein [Providencia rettgeri]
MFSIIKFYILLFLTVFICHSLPSIAETINFDGIFVEDACDLYPGDELITLDFGTIADKYLYLNSRTLSESFSIRLINCDLSLGREINASFNGNENSFLSGYLALDPVSHANGIAIGLETDTGEKIDINTKDHTQKLSAGNNEIRLKAFIQGEPSALTNKTISYGTFISTLTFFLEYN